MVFFVSFLFLFFFFHLTFKKKILLQPQPPHNNPYSTPCETPKNLIHIQPSPHPHTNTQNTSTACLPPTSPADSARLLRPPQKPSSNDARRLPSFCVRPTWIQPFNHHPDPSLYFYLLLLFRLLLRSPSWMDFLRLFRLETIDARYHVNFYLCTHYLLWVARNVM